ncbi:DUF4153 domain-containing protein [Kitasatospora gansuensis]
MVALVLAAVPWWTDAGWPTFLAVAAALGVASLALHGGARWAGVLLGPIGLWAHLLPSLFWAAESARGRSTPPRRRCCRYSRRRWSPRCCWWSSEPCSPARTRRSPTCSTG